MNIQIRNFVVLFLVLLCGCASAPPPRSLNSDPLLRIASLDANHLFAATQEGRHVAIAKDGLQLLALESNVSQSLSLENPVAMKWAPDDTTLAAAFSLSDYETRLILYASGGEVLHESLLPIALSQMVWSARGDLLLVGYALKIYSFGGNLQQSLYRLDEGKVIKTLLSDTTLKPATAKKLESIMPQVLPVIFSPLGDELVCIRFHDPPEFPPYINVLYRNWQSGDARVIKELPLQELRLGWGPHQDSVTINLASARFDVDLWPAGEPVNSVDAYRFANGQLYEGDDLLADWGEGAELQRLNDGSFLLAVQRGLYAGHGLRAESVLPQYSEKRWTVRRWRYQGLITPEEYLEVLSEEKQ